MSDDRCQEFDAMAAGREAGDEGEGRWNDHLAGCADCREQASADALLRGTLGQAPAPPEVSAAFEGRLRRRLQRRTAGRPITARRTGGLRPSGLWALAAYGTAATGASAAILARLPWESLAPSPALLVTVGALALLSPLALLDRVGIVRPPG